VDIPQFNSEFVCIIDRENPVLAAVISSYLHKNDCYLSLFEFGMATIQTQIAPTEGFDEHYITRSRSEELNVKINNSLKKMGGCEYLILGGLSENQKSYLTFLDQYKCIEIDTIVDVELCLSGIAYDKNNFLAVRSNEAQTGLYFAAKLKSILKIDNNADYLTESLQKAKGIIIVENNGFSSTVIAVNYALSVNASLKIIEPLEEDEAKEIIYHIENWQRGNTHSFLELQRIMCKKIECIEFSEYEFATFFTEGAPYSLILKNIIPFTYVNLTFNTGFFIFDNIYIENKESIGSSIVFSPLVFGVDEETEFVINLLKKERFYVRELTGKDASVNKIEMHVKEYPYDLLHICSHGGEVSGYSLVKEFVDRVGVSHVIEYDEVISFAPEKGKSLIQVTCKQIWRKFDKFIWKSKELKDENYPHFVFIDMINAVHNRSGEKYSGIPKSIVSDSCAIKCYDFNYQAVFNLVSCFHTSPIIFNNTCWSWSGISESFLACGVRGYIGTLWSINNSVANNSAKIFYENLFDNTILNSLQKSFKATIGTSSENIYLFWGLHFSTFKRGVNIKQSRINITHLLLLSFYRWIKQAEEVSNVKIKSDIQRLADWDMEQLKEFFLIETIEKFKESPSLKLKNL